MHPDFWMPQVRSIDGRTSSITAAFIKSITPVIEPTEAEVDEVLRLLGMTKGKCVCAYCGDPHTEWDHFRPVVVDKRPTGYVTEIANLVPSCGKCNQSKGGKHWKTWMLSTARRSPSTRGKPDVRERIAKLEVFERWRKPTRIDYEGTVGSERWSAYLDKLDQIAASLKLAQLEADILREMVAQSVGGNCGVRPRSSLSSSKAGG